MHSPHMHTCRNKHANLHGNRSYHGQRLAWLTNLDASTSKLMKPWRFGCLVQNVSALFLHEKMRNDTKISCSFSKSAVRTHVLVPAVSGRRQYESRQPRGSIQSKRFNARQMSPCSKLRLGHCQQKNTGFTAIAENMLIDLATGLL